MVDIDKGAIAEVYSRLGDDLSRQIYTDTLLYILTHDKKYIGNLAKTTSEGKKFYRKIEDAEYVYGGGYYGEWIVESFDNNWKGVIDSDPAKQGECIKGIRVISISEVPNDSYVCIANRYSHRDILESLLEKGFSQDRILDLGDYLERLEKRQYFDLPTLPKDKITTFLDVGALDGNTALNFIEWKHGEYKRVICLEPDEKNVLRCQRRLEESDNVEVLPVGAWSENTTLKFISSGEMSSRVSDDGTNVIEARTLDSLLTREYQPRELYIKMDIEGAEADALKGAEGIIRDNGPALAICTYHNADDLWRLPQMILSYRDDYTFFFRHYHLGQQETVLYAV